MEINKMRDYALQLIKTGVDSAEPESLVNRNIVINGDKIKICDKTFNRSEFKEIVMLGIGKASPAMASGCEKVNPDDGLIITKLYNKENENQYPLIDIKKGGHPYPNEDSFEATKNMISKVENKEDCLFIFLISGGGSSLLSFPVKGVKIDELNLLNRLMIKSGANIHEINTVRKHLSQVKGGRLAKLCRPHGKVISLILSDVVGDKLSDIASGPTCTDKTTFEDAKVVLKKYRLWERIPKSIRDHIKKGIAGEIEDTSEKIDADNFLIGNNLTALKGVKEMAEEMGFNSMILTSQNMGEAKEVAKTFAGIAKEVQDSFNPLKPPAALIFGGETTVDMNYTNGVEVDGGPNREFVLSFAKEIRNREKIVIASVDTDGTDGRGKAGAIADGNSINRSNFDADDLLKTHRSQKFFDELGDSIEFKSRTNVNDISIILIDEIEKV